MTDEEIRFTWEIAGDWFRIVDEMMPEGHDVTYDEMDFWWVFYREIARRQAGVRA